MKRIIFATGNVNKIKEIRFSLGAHDRIDIIGLSELGYDKEIPETGKTLEENAILKAETIFSKFGAPCIAEDSGLEVFSLDGAPGVFSARYGGEANDAGVNMDLLLKNLESKNDRRAQFRAVIAYKDYHAIHLFEGVVTGRISHTKRGEFGFGYDPIFQPDGLEGTFGELGPAIKSKISHRSKAWAKCLPYLIQSSYK
jgi:XTP/dITP diphosphohydrolase